jgi:hypothetical protein
MSEIDYSLKALLGLLLAVIVAPTQFILITLWLLMVSIVMRTWYEIYVLQVKNLLTITETLSEVFWMGMKKMAVLFFLLTSGTALSKFASAYSFFELAVYTGIGIWLFSEIAKNATKILQSSGLEETLRKLIERYTEIK